MLYKKSIAGKLIGYFIMSKQKSANQPLETPSKYQEPVSFKEELYYQKISEPEIDKIKLKIKQKGNKQRKILFWITIMFSSITFISLYIFIEILIQ